MMSEAGTSGTDDGPTGRDEDAGRRDQAVVGGDHRGVAGPEAPDDPRVRDVGDLGVPNTEVAERGDVGFRAVGEPRDHREPAGCARTFEPRFGRPDLDRPGRGPGRVAPGAVGDPGADHPVLPRPGREPLPPLVRHLPGGLQQDQAAVRIEDVHAAPAGPARDRLEVAGGVGAEEAQVQPAPPLE